MEPKKYIQYHHTGKTRIYKGKLPPIENGPYEEYVETKHVSLQATNDEQNKNRNYDRVVLIGAIAAAAGVIGGALWLLL